MGNQSLDHDEILCLRWAHDDPNPVAQDAINRADRDALYALMTAKGISLDNAGFEYPAEYSIPSAKKARLEDGTDLTAQHPELAYPDTDQQFAQDEPQGVAAPATSSTETSSMTAEEYAKYCEDYYINYLNSQNISIGDYGDNVEDSTAPTQNSAALTASSVPSKEEAGPSTSDVWAKCVDEETGAIYYFNETTQESSWGLPSSA